MGWMRTKKMEVLVAWWWLYRVALLKTSAHDLGVLLVDQVEALARSAYYKLQLVHQLRPVPDKMDLALVYHLQTLLLQCSLHGAALKTTRTL